jgi:acetyl esterase/lipase
MMKLAGILITLIVSGGAQAEKIEGVVFADVGGTLLKLDLYLPEAKKAPVIVYVHGGAWRSGNRSGIPLDGMVERGFAVASVDYRLSGVARFPAQIHDIKAAIRFLRAKAREFGYDAGRIVVSGSSAGAHLAALGGCRTATRNWREPWARIRRSRPRCRRLCLSSAPAT